MHQAPARRPPFARPHGPQRSRLRRAELPLGRHHVEVRQAHSLSSKAHPRRPNAMKKNAVVFRAIVYVAIFCTAFAVYVMRAASSNALTQPPEAGDGHDYDAIAFNIWQGRGFGYQWSDEAWRKPYEGIARYRLLLMRKSDFSPTTYRPPAMPYLLSVVY